MVISWLAAFDTAGGGEAFPAGMKVRLVALQAQERFCLLKQGSGHCTVRIMTEAAVFHHRGMFKNERALFIGMTVEAQIIQPFMGLQVFNHRTVVGMAAAALHFAFPERMPRGKVDFGHDVFVAVHTQLRI